MYKDWSCINSRQEVRYQQPLLYKLKMQLLDQESDVNMGQTPCTELPSDRDGLVAELRVTEDTEICFADRDRHFHQGGRRTKKGLRIGHEELNNREKTILIDALRDKYPLNALLWATGIAKSSFLPEVGSSTDR